MQKWLKLLALLALLPFAATQAKALSLDDMKLETTQNLVDICSVDEAHPDWAPIMTFCVGYIWGAGDFHNAITKSPNVARLICAGDDVDLSVRQVVDIFLVWAEGNPQHMGEPPVEGLARAFVEKFPCEK